MIKKLIKKLVGISLILGMFATSPILMDHAKDIYFTEVIGSNTVSFTMGKAIYGTGFYVKHKGKSYILTNRHICLYLHSKKSAAYADSLKGSYIDINTNGKGKIINISNVYDLCLVESDSDKGLDLASSYHINEKVTIMGHPRGLQKTFREGRIFDKGREYFWWIPFKYSDYLHLSVIGYGGNSGSAVVNRYGNVVGVVFAGSTRYHTEMMAVTLADVKYYLEKFAK